MYVFCDRSGMTLVKTRWKGVDERRVWSRVEWRTLSTDKAVTLGDWVIDLQRGLVLIIHHETKSHTLIRDKTDQVKDGVDNLPVGHLVDLHQTDEYGELEAVVARHAHDLLGPLDLDVDGLRGRHLRTATGHSESTLNHSTLEHTVCTRGDTVCHVAI